MESPNVAVVATHVNGRPRCAIRGEIDVVTAPTVGCKASITHCGVPFVKYDLSDQDYRHRVAGVVLPAKSSGPAGVNRRSSFDERCC